MNWASIASVGFAAMAAGFWAWSSLVNVPIIGSGFGTLVNVEPFYSALTTIARLNTAAASCACASAIAQAINLWHGT
jgi:hypothetical protein